MTSMRRKLEKDLSKPVAASGLLFVGVSTFAIGKVVGDRHTDPEREWTEIQLYDSDGRK